MDISGCAGPVLRHDNNKASQGQHRASFTFCQALVDGIILRNDLRNYQFTVEQQTKDQQSIPTTENDHKTCFLLSNTCCTS